MELRSLDKINSPPLFTYNPILILTIDFYKLMQGGAIDILFKDKVFKDLFEGSVIFGYITAEAEHGFPEIFVGCCKAQSQESFSPFAEV